MFLLFVLRRAKINLCVGQSDRAVQVENLWLENQSKQLKGFSPHQLYPERQDAKEVDNFTVLLLIIGKAQVLLITLMIAVLCLSATVRHGCEPAYTLIAFRTLKRKQLKGIRLSSSLLLLFLKFNSHVCFSQTDMPL